MPRLDGLAPRPDQPLRIAYLVYRGNPHCGGQGVYTRELVRELADLGHEVTVFSGQPYPDLADPDGLQRVPSLDLYRPENPFRVPWPWEFKTTVDLREFAIMCGAGFPEPYTFSVRARRLLKDRRADFDLVHDNQCLGRGLIPMMEKDGWPVIATLHHPITVDRDLDLAHAPNAWRRFTLRRWYGFLGMQMEVARQIPRHLTVSESSRRDISAQMGVPIDRLNIVPVGVDPTVFAPRPHIARVPGRLMTTASADVPMKGLAPAARGARQGPHRGEQRAPRRDRQAQGEEQDPAAHRAARARRRGRVRERGHHRADRRALRRGRGRVRAVAVRGLLAPRGRSDGVRRSRGRHHRRRGARGDRHRRRDRAARSAPSDPDALAGAILRALRDAPLRARIGAAGRARALEKFTWRQTAVGTVEQYRALLEEHSGALAGRPGGPRSDP